MLQEILELTHHFQGSPTMRKLQSGRGERATPVSQDADATANARVLLIAGAITLMICVGSIGAFAAFWHRHAFEDVIDQPWGFPGAIAVFLAGAIVHELLHAFTWKSVARVPWSAISIKRHRRKLGLIAHVTVPVSAYAYRLGVTVPALVLGLLPIIVGLVQGRGVVVLWGCVFLFESFSDVAILIATGGVPSAAFVLEHPTKLGCRITLVGVPWLNDEARSIHGRENGTKGTFGV